MAAGMLLMWLFSVRYGKESETVLLGVKKGDLLWSFLILRSGGKFGIPVLSAPFLLKRYKLFDLHSPF